MYEMASKLRVTLLTLWRKQRVLCFFSLLQSLFTTTAAVVAVFFFENYILRRLSCLRSELKLHLACNLSPRERGREKSQCQDKQVVQPRFGRTRSNCAFFILEPRVTVSYGNCVAVLSTIETAHLERTTLAAGGPFGRIEYAPAAQVQMEESNSQKCRDGKSIDFS